MHTIYISLQNLSYIISYCYVCTQPHRELKILFGILYAVDKCVYLINAEKINNIIEIMIEKRFLKRTSNCEMCCRASMCITMHEVERG